ncbi:tRNA 5-methoxyuridine(34)/uridine 5-oxyacetic acid(34) synthase CmoB [Methylococcus sp. EFPC2]|uniref:tRNA 5-methoxyuridine(34)/uridine 5-oxyacetic acid(34) synthase CmoB n=1 Tax=Methylococcus sp. EFPC2 TaxID=2812648 RepID=UPI001967F528|nr:tRNA 5-methoxyuridine(34)/uridine 5-oxyacetic acid(34) synthase CmoB [Methylococcus sp. EFPC2]
MLNYTDLLDATDVPALEPWLRELPDLLASRLDPSGHGDLGRWLDVLARLPDIAPGKVDLASDTVSISADGEIGPQVLASIDALLRELHPWRKGPYSVHGIHIDTEWRSDLKWRRLADRIRPLNGKTVLDVGCGSGYHGWRMAGAGARRVIGIDPTLLSVVQFHAIKHFAGAWPVHVLPLGIEDMPADLKAFDTVFSMGVLYHRRSPIDHLYELRGLLKTGGELVLETLVIEGGPGTVLVPEDRYACMRNVWFIPSCPTLEAWLKRCGFRNVRLVDVSRTTPEEQRSTDWMRFQSLADFLDAGDPDLTREGLPAPRRAVFLAESPC